VIAGGPRAGKSHLTSRLAGERFTVHGSDELARLEWSDSSLAASLWLDQPGPWICEGVAMVRALRKWLERSGGAPADLIIWLNEPVVARSRGQHVMALGCETIWKEIRPELAARNARILEVSNGQLDRSS
jgi:hypothetical protein